jgi:hypothetical protein
MATKIIIDTDIEQNVAMLRSRAESLKVQAGGLTPVLATSYRRRASELELQAYLLEAANLDIAV